MYPSVHGGNHYESMYVDKRTFFQADSMCNVDLLAEYLVEQEGGLLGRGYVMAESRQASREHGLHTHFNESSTAHGWIGQEHITGDDIHSASYRYIHTYIHTYSQPPSQT